MFWTNFFFQIFIFYRIIFLKLNLIRALKPTSVCDVLELILSSSKIEKKILKRQRFGFFWYGYLHLFFRINTQVFFTSRKETNWNRIRMFTKLLVFVALVACLSSVQAVEQDIRIRFYFGWVFFKVSFKCIFLSTKYWIFKFIVFNSPGTKYKNMTSQTSTLSETTHLSAPIEMLSSTTTAFHKLKTLTTSVKLSTLTFQPTLPILCWFTTTTWPQTQSTVPDRSETRLVTPTADFVTLVCPPAAFTWSVSHSELRSRRLPAEACKADSVAVTSSADSPVWIQDRSRQFSCLLLAVSARPTLATSTQSTLKLLALAITFRSVTWLTLSTVESSSPSALPRSTQFARPAHTTSHPRCGLRQFVPVPQFFQLVSVALGTISWLTIATLQLQSEMSAPSPHELFVAATSWVQIYKLLSQDLSLRKKNLTVLIRY